MLRNVPSHFFPALLLSDPIFTTFCLEDLSCTAYHVLLTLSPFLLSSYFLFSEAAQAMTKPSPATATIFKKKNSSKIKHTGKVLECLLLLFAFFPSPVGAHLSCPVSELIPLVTGASSSSLHCLWLKTDALWERRSQNFYIPTPSPLLGCHSVLYTHTCTALLLCLFPFLSFYLLG